MADINVERKSTAIWPWILGLIVLALLGWLVAEMLDDDVEEEPVVGVVETAPATTDPMMPAAAPSGAAVPEPVQQYLSVCAPREPDMMTLDHQYTSRCIQQLTSAVEATLQNPNLAGVNVQTQFQDAQRKAGQLQQSATESTRHAEMTREAFVSIAAVLGGIQDARFPALDGQVSQLEQTAQGIQSGANLLDQRDAVQNFFKQAGDVLNAMASSPAAGG